MQINLDYPFVPRERGINKHILKLFDISENILQYTDFIRQFKTFSSYFDEIPIKVSNTEKIPFWRNGWFHCFDAASLYSLLSINNPKFYVEIGSGNSTKFARRAIQDHNLRTKIISIDPSPRAEIDSICDYVFRTRCEDMNLSFFENLAPSTILFMDGSHRSFQNSDVTVFFTEIIPTFKTNTIWGIHDITLPLDYMQKWATRYYNEQYLLATYLLAGAGNDKILLPNHYITNVNKDLSKMVKQTLFNNPRYNETKKSGSAFWFKRM